MPRITKAMLEEDVRIYRGQNIELRKEISNLKQTNQLLLKKDFDVEGFCRMHAEGITALSHALTDLRVIIQKLH